MPIRARAEPLRAARPAAPSHVTPQPLAGDELVPQIPDRAIDGDSARVIHNLVLAQPTDIDAQYFETVQGDCLKSFFFKRTFRVNARNEMIRTYPFLFD